MTQEPTDIFEVLSSYYESESVGSESSFLASSEDDNTEISEDRDFVVSDGESLVYTEGSSVSSDDSELEEPNSEYDDAAGVGKKFPISAIAQRVINRNGVLVTQYLVLWQSWEDSYP
ncbi:uncharacterized protein N7473_004371 [Penicillium subrubescens]|uniref:uncharacterized protein n=1 Tax=Penicillium subrubescens TaxID=1316194 RepID=UPI0025457268|nr:uncharacterized protein N7473_004371 [Penicillium subrubescens]KAJ5900301.1 hypothetical protein N7473_004371 [Penicillium subrubescens]